MSLKDTVSKEAVQLKMDEYYANGDFLAPLPVKRVSNGIALAGNYEQFCAAQELSLSECRCIFHG